MFREMLAQAVVNLLDSGQRHVTQGHASLVRNDDHLTSGAVQVRNGLFYTGKQVEFLPAGNILTFPRLMIQNSVPI